MTYVVVGVLIMRSQRHDQGYLRHRPSRHHRRSREPNHCQPTPRLRGRIARRDVLGYISFQRPLVNAGGLPIFKSVNQPTEPIMTPTLKIAIVLLVLTLMLPGIISIAMTF